MSDVLQEEVLQKAAALASNTDKTTKIRSVRASLTEWDKWTKAAESHSLSLNAFVRVVMNEASTYVLDHNASKHDARESRNQLLDVVRGRGPVSKYFDRR